MKTNNRTSCRCGKSKPYRRAFKCGDCWQKVSRDERIGLEKGRDSLRLKESKVGYQGEGKRETMAREASRAVLHGRGRLEDRGGVKVVQRG